jgi:hypothetical protein
MNVTEVAMAVEKKVVARDKGKIDVAAAVENLAVGGTGFEGAEGRCGFLAPAICVM